MDLECTQDWYDHETKSIEETPDFKLPWDFPIQMDHKIEQNRHYIVVLDKKAR